LQYLPSARVCR